MMLIKLFNRSIALRLLVAALILNLAACGGSYYPVSSYTVKFPIKVEYPALEIAPLPLNAALVLPESITSAAHKEKVSYTHGSTEITVPAGKALERGSFEIFSRAFKNLQLVTDKDSAIGQYDVLIELTPSKLSMYSSESDPGCPWILYIPLFWLELLKGCPDAHGYVNIGFGITAMVTDSSGSILLAEEKDRIHSSGQNYSDDLGEKVQKDLNEILIKLTLRLTSAPKLIQYAKSLPVTPEERMKSRQTVVVKAEPVPIIPLPTDEKLPSLRKDAHALVIGIDYKGREGIPSLQYASQDAKKVYAALTDPRYGGVPKENATHCF